MSKFSKIYFVDSKVIYGRFQSYVKTKFHLKYSVLGFLQSRKFTKLASINGNLDDCLHDETPSFSMKPKKQYSKESFVILFKKCNNIIQLENLVNRLFHKHHIPHPHTIKEAFKACSRLILDEQNKIPLNDFSVNLVNEDMSKYWIDIPSNTHTTTDDVIKVANQIIEKLDQNCKTTYVYNSYILVCGIAKRTDLAFAAYNEMLKTFIRLDIGTYKSLIFAYANKSDLDQAFNIIDSSIDSIFFSLKSKVWVKTTIHLGIGALIAKWLTFGLATVVQDINSLAVTGIGLSAFLSMRYAMHTIFKDTTNLEIDDNDFDISSDLKLSKMRPKEIRKYMYTYLLSCLLRNGKFNEALIVLHQMANNEIPLDIISFNKIIANLCRARNSSAALETVIKFQEHGFRPTKQTFQPIIHSFMNHGCNEGMRESLYNLMNDNNVSFPNS
ncbi:hypothetical protein RclHR1_01940009 [Rhizophagus clarus]|uniref:Pentatricopeptide repeat-containing protein At2g16880 n=1 Tax=Rhizophagus clarus TaxID=94130 RepID=A0A2Z6QTU0_9GLOM|nr:hypothetical protein RclHR1_01940009 [Rhizophagus clarus]GES93664.1 pentatricopeptide repeat-containing protein At2g16880 [Rhizophagus clarus]